MKLEDLPTFRADRTEIVGDQTFVYGRFDVLPIVYGEHSWLFNATVAYCGDLEVLDPDAKSVVFKCWDFELIEELFDPGLAWMCCSYNPNDVWLVMDETAVWTGTEFRVSDSVAKVENGWRSMRLLTSPNLDISAPAEPGPTEFVVPGGWTHEHCFICDGYIDEVRPLYYRFSEGERAYWCACPDCYQSWIVNHDIGFVFEDRREEV